MADDFGFVPDNKPATDDFGFVPATAAPVAQQPTMAGATANTLGLVNGATVGFAPKIAAASRHYIIDPIMDATGIGGTGQTYQQTLADYQRNHAVAQQQYPGAYLSGDLAGGLLPGAAAKTGLIANAALGAVKGGNAGAPEDTVSNMALGGGLGVAGAAAGKAVAGAGKAAAGNLVDAVSNAYKISRDEATAMLKSATGGMGVPDVGTLGPLVGQLRNLPHGMAVALASKMNLPAAALGYLGGHSVGSPVIGTMAGAIPYLGTAAKIASDAPAAAGVLGRQAVQAAGGLTTQASKGPMGAAQSLALTQLRNDGVLQGAGIGMAGVPATVGGEVVAQQDNRSRLEKLTDEMRQRFGF